MIYFVSGSHSVHSLGKEKNCTEFMQIFGKLRMCNAEEGANTL